ncbi:hypothetical protein ACIGHB_33360 [Streptomyces sp. NPDC085460]|uniref:hypothetical protein n=1 Tax=Streptomyces sp. NPDC085460 TaxID=3365723 RepID=UPI0037D44E00
MRAHATVAAITVGAAALAGCSSPPEEPPPAYTVTSRIGSGSYVDIEVAVDRKHRLKDVFDQVLADNVGSSGYFIKIMCGADGPNNKRALAFGKMASDEAGAYHTGLLSAGMYQFDLTSGASCP